MPDIKVPATKTLHKSANIKVTMTYGQSLEGKLNNFFGLYGALQKEIDGRFMDEIEEYMPYDQGNLIMSMIDNTTLGAGMNITRSEYAFFVYYGMLMIDPDTGSPFARAGAIKVLTDIELQYQGAPKRGRLWDERWAADNYDSFITRMQDFTDRNLRL